MSCLLGKIDLLPILGTQSKRKPLLTPSAVAREKPNFFPDAIHPIIKKKKKSQDYLSLIEIFS